jgi:hypothetical protein
MHFLTNHKYTMKTKFNFQIRFMNMLVALLAVSSISLLSSCDDDDEPTREDTPELVTTATLTFTPVMGGNAITVTASDPDGTGVQDLAPDGPINLADNTIYTLDITLINELADPGDEEYNITEEVDEEDEEHMFFFSWTNNLFSDPAGNGNIDNRADDVNYNDFDDNGQPLGLMTTWTTGAAGTGKFRVVLKHQPELKSATSSATTGETDVDIEFDVTIQ